MEFEQKAEEKKMSMSKNIARLAVTAGLTAALSFGGVMAPVTMAFAAGTPTVATEPGKVFIADTEYTNTSFKGIQIFTARVTQDMKNDGWDDSVAKTLSDIQWAPGNVKPSLRLRSRTLKEHLTLMLTPRRGPSSLIKLRA